LKRTHPNKAYAVFIALILLGLPSLLFGAGNASTSISGAKVHIKSPIAPPPSIRKAAALFQAAIKLQMKGKYDEAEKVYQRILKITPQATPVYMNLALINQIQKQYPKAVSYYLDACRVDPKNSYPYAQLALLYMQMGEPNKAKPWAEKSIQLNPKNAQAHFVLGGCDMIDRDFPAAEKEYRACVQLADKNMQSHYNLGFVLAQEGKYDEALSEFDKAEKLDPRNGSIDFYIGLIHERQKRYQDALIAYKRGIAKLPDSLPLWFNLGVVYQYLGGNNLNSVSIQKSISCYLRALSINPKYLPAQVNAARLYYLIGNYAEAANHFNIASKLSPKDSRLQADAGLADVMAGNTCQDPKRRGNYFADAEAHYVAGIASHPIPALFTGLAYLYSLTGNNAKALSVCKDWTKDLPKDPNGWIALGKAQQSMNKYPDAEKAMKQALAIDPKNTDALLALATLYNQEQKTPLAVQTLQSAIAKDPKNIAAYRQLAQLDEQLKKYPDAIEEYNKIIALNPKDSESYLSIGRIYELQDQYDKAIAEYKSLSQVDSTDILPLTYIAHIQEEQKKYDDAISTYRQILKLQPGNVMFASDITRLMELEGHYDEAIAEYRKLLQADPNNASYHIKIGSLLEKENKTDAAVAEYLAALKIGKDNTLVAAKLGDIYVKEGKYQDALNLYYPLVKNPISKELAYTEIQHVYMSEKNPAGWGTYLEGQISQDPDNISALTHYEAYSVEYKQTDRMFRFLAGIAQKAPKNREFLMQYAALLGRNGEQSEALPIYRQAAHILPNDYEGVQTAAMQYELAGKLNDAIELNNEILKMKNVPPKTLLNVRLELGSIYEKQGNKQQAESEYKEALQIDPKNVIATQAMKRLGA